MGMCLPLQMRSLMPFASMGFMVIAACTLHIVACSPCLSQLSDIAVTSSSNASLWALTHNVSNPEWDGRIPAQPGFVALPRSAHDVQRCLRCAMQHKLRVSVKDGGHSFGGYSSLPASQGFMINLKFMAGVSDIGACGPSGVSTITVQAGATWYDVYHAFERSGREWVVNGGLCPTVGVAGFTMGGGVGPAAKMYGLGADGVRSFTMITVDGERVIVANETSNPDLFWALRGGGGGNFGVVIDMTLEIHAGPPLYTFGEVCFEWSQSSELLDAIQRFDDKLPRDLNVDAVIGKGGSCLWITSQRPLNLTRELLSPILQTPAASPTKDTLTEWDCFWHGIVDFSQQHGYSEYDSQPYYSKNCLLDSITPELASTLVNLTESAPAACGGSQHFIGFGGKVAEVLPNATAFPWRSSKYMVYSSCSYTLGDDASRKVAKDYMKIWEAGVFPFCNGGSYINFIDPLAKSVDRYYGEALPKLKTIKQQWVPAGFSPLRFPKEIPISDMTFLV